MFSPTVPASMGASWATRVTFERQRGSCSPEKVSFGEFARDIGGRDHPHELSQQGALAAAGRTVEDDELALVGSSMDTSAKSSRPSPLRALNGPAERNGGMGQL